MLLLINKFVCLIKGADEIDPLPLKKKDQVTGTLQSNETNPYLYNDYRVYREKYANGDHGCPNPDAKRYW